MTDEMLFQRMQQQGQASRDPVVLMSHTLHATLSAFST